MTVVPLVNCKEAPPDTVQSCFVAPCPVYTWRISPHWGPCQARHSVRPPPLPVKSVRACGRAAAPRRQPVDRSGCSRRRAVMASSAR
jgi:hypothetical protein